MIWSIRVSDTEVVHVALVKICRRFIELNKSVYFLASGLSSPRRSMLMLLVNRNVQSQGIVRSLSNDSNCSTSCCMAI